MQVHNDKGVDQFHADYRLYLEGIEIPFESVTISQVYKQTPRATITLPMLPGLPDIGRNYQPKVHVFWRSPNYDMGSYIPTRSGTEKRKNSRDEFKLIFSGIVNSTTDSKEVSYAGGGQNVTLECSHALPIINNILIRFANQQIPAVEESTDPNADGATTVAAWSSDDAMVRALMGVRSDARDGEVEFIPDGTWDRLKGTPGMLRVVWNIIKQDAVRKYTNGENSDALVSLYIPLIEEGLKVWERMSGHPEIEEGINSSNGRVKHSVDDPKKGTKVESGKIMIPSVFRTFIGDAAQKETTVLAMNALAAGFGSPEASNVGDIFNTMLERLEYDLLVLASPVSTGLKKTPITEYIVKPEMPYYYSPICNVVLPNMLTSVSVTNAYDSMPTRSTSLNSLTYLVGGNSSGGGPAHMYTAPHSVRYARAGGSKGALDQSLSANKNSVGRYEWGCGIKSETSMMPPMYNVLNSYLKKDKKDDNKTVGDDVHSKVLESWKNMYDEDDYPGVDKYNPWDAKSGIESYQRLNFLFADREFNMATAKSRNATAAGSFNPYAIVGYPMDLVDPVPERESYHGLCTSITHSIHASGTAFTNYGLSAVSTINELAAYKIPGINPYLTGVLDFTEDQRIYRNANAYKKACKVYQTVLGVGAAEPGLLQDYDTGEPISFKRDMESGCWALDGDGVMLNTLRGNMFLTARDIQSLEEVEDEIESDFVDIADWAYYKADGTVGYGSKGYDGEITRDMFQENELRKGITVGKTKISTKGLDTESSPFLDYEGEEYV